MSADVNLAALVDAVRWARWYFHCEAMRDRGEDTEGDEVAIEIGLALAKAVMPFDPDTPACKGCANGPNVWAWSARALLADQEVLRVAVRGDHA